MVYCCHYKDVNKFRCPDVCGKVDCVQSFAWCSNSNYVHVTNTRPKDDPRYISTPHRGSKTWQEKYDKSISVEKNFCQVKRKYVLKKCQSQGQKER